MISQPMLLKTKTNKVFRDPVHNYIYIPDYYIKNFIDTPIFQRLRSIEQTSYRPLFHCAHHDRFAHSIGVYHIASKIIDYLLGNARDGDVKRILEALKMPFEVAALMHDCAHAPFSHTLEYFYDRAKNSITSKLLKLAEEKEKYLFGDYFYGDLENILIDVAPHEKASAYIFVKHYYDSYVKLLKEKSPSSTLSPEIIIRMITGCTHNEEVLASNDDQKVVENHLIGLINGLPIDVDRIDYVMRDTWSMGINNVTIDIDRLLSSMVIDRDKSGKLKLAYSISAADIVKDVIAARNLFPERVIKHHIVVYFRHLLEKSVEMATAKIFDETNDCEDKYDVLNVETFDKPIERNNHSYYLTSDGDIMYLLKMFVREKYVDEILSRRPSRIPLWKTIHDFKDIMVGKQDKKKQLLSTQTKLIKLFKTKFEEKIDRNEIGLSSFSKEDFLKQIDDVLVVDATPKYAKIPQGEVFFVTENGIKESTYCGLPGNNTSRIEHDELKYFIIYIPRDLQEYKKYFIEIIRDFLQ